MPTTTPRGYSKAVGGDNWRTYLKTALAATLDLIDADVTAAIAGGGVTLSGAQDVSHKSMVIDRAIGGGTGVFRSDAGVEIRGPTADALLSLRQSENPGTTGPETAIAYGAFNGAGAIAKTASVSSKWADPAAATMKGILRLNATYKDPGGAGTLDDVAIRVLGNDGVDFHGSSDTAGPGAGKVRFNGAGGVIVAAGGLSVKGQVATPSADTTANATRLVLAAGNSGNPAVELRFYRSTALAGEIAFDGDTTTVVAGRTKAASDLVTYVGGTVTSLVDTSGNLFQLGALNSGGGLVVRGVATPPAADTSNTSVRAVIAAGSHAGANDTNVELRFYRSSALAGEIGYDSDTTTVVAGHTKGVADFLTYVGGTIVSLVDGSGNLYQLGGVAVGAGGLSLPGGTLLTTRANLTNGAAAATGTLTNAPAAGNPTKWIPVNDNGTTRYIPAW